MLKLMCSLILSSILLNCSAIDAAVVRRAAFDFGSGKIEMQVADVDLDAKKIVNSLYSDNILVNLSADSALHKDGHFSKEIQDHAIASAKQLKEKALALGATEIYGVATEAYRHAPNAQQLVDRYLNELQIPVKIISQAEEGTNGFFALITEANLNPSEVIAWEIGGGSLQITYLDQDNNIHSYMAPFGRVTSMLAIIQHVKGKNPAKTRTPNPMNIHEWNAALDYFSHTLPNIPDSLTLKLQQPNVQLIGIGAHPAKLRTLPYYTTQDLLALRDQYLNKEDFQLHEDLHHPAPTLAVSDLALVYSVMQKLNASSVHYFQVRSGTTTALLLRGLGDSVP